MNNTSAAPIRTTKSRFASKCCQCLVALPVGSEVGVTHDRTWRCLDCTKMFAEMGPAPKGPYLVRADFDAHNARVLAIQEKYGKKWTFDPYSKKVAR